MKYKYMTIKKVGKEVPANSFFGILEQHKNENCVIEIDNTNNIYNFILGNRVTLYDIDKKKNKEKMEKIDKIIKEYGTEIKN